MRSLRAAQAEGTAPAQGDLDTLKALDKRTDKSVASVSERRHTN